MKDLRAKLEKKEDKIRSKAAKMRWRLKNTKEYMRAEIDEAQQRASTAIRMASEVEDQVFRAYIFLAIMAIFHVAEIIALIVMLKLILR